MFGSFFVSGLFLMSSGLLNVENGIDNEQSIKVLAELDKLPLIVIDVYEINFRIYGELTEINENGFSVFSFQKGKVVFAYNGNLSEFSEGEMVGVYYNYLPDGGREVVRIRKVSDER